MRSFQAVLWLLAFLALTGLALVFCYVPSASSPPPSVPGAGASVGPVLRGLHFWAAQIVLLAVLIHLGRAVFVKTNRRRLAWAAALVILTALFWFTGILLPWDQLAFWMQQRWLRGISAQESLWIVYGIHTLALSALTLPFLIAYVRRTRRDFPDAA